MLIDDLDWHLEFRKLWLLQINMRRTDLIEDTGASISPEVDVGQVEGGYVMSLGLWTTEEIKYDPDTGRLLTNGTWVSLFTSCIFGRNPE